MQTSPSTLYIGLMSGTSMDGVDAVLADFNEGINVLAHHSAPYPPTLLQALRHAASGAALSASEWLDLDHRSGQHFADCALTLIKNSDTPATDIAAIGSHGQTVWHQPLGQYRNSWQLGDANIIAALTQVTTVADFRRMDMAFGGQGAPLVPAFHADLFAKTEQARVILNLGGIANITALTPKQAVRGYDTGPANCLLDAHYRHCFDQPYDENGEWAASGSIHQDLLAAMLHDGYFSKPAPKSTGPEHFSWAWLAQHLQQHDCSGADLQATLTALSAYSIAAAIKQEGAKQVIACGGGVLNAELMTQLAAALPAACSLVTTAEFGIDPQHIEALAFAWLAKQRLAGRAGNMPSVTGATQDCLLGAIYQPLATD